MQTSSITSPEIKILPEIVRKNGFDYKLVQRNNKCCIYSQHNGIGAIVAYEIFKHKVIKYSEKMKKLAKLNDTKVSDDLPEFAEVFPGNEEFGKRAWTYQKLESALSAIK